ncbi:HAMP domain-containing histidine kinase [Brucepastera parasyntrophica]|uniref:sensor histidine kinase n=1 Tax=Brucepastera parasyntrophica TaxID=2880008 RepID=UPI00210E877D|nr:HAMP domain-containing sensor histidine kinase [Brucepastera parasyntrophica]ULQ60301.1 HAMP domain-containing histidine kinase [Brucepastera parasyntrophica]
MKIPARTFSLIISLVSWILLSVLIIFIAFLIQDRARLISESTNERILNVLFTSLIDYDDFGSAIEASPALQERIAGVGLYGNNLQSSYIWGNAPDSLDKEMAETAEKPRNGRYTALDKKNGSMRFVILIGGPMDYRDGPRDRPQTHHNERPGKMPGPPIFDMVRGGKYLYIEIIHSEYWQTRRMLVIFIPIIELLFALLIFYVRRLYLNNAEYRQRIEDQKNLVFLGTAAGTLAHEIKNPLLAIRLDTEILRKLSEGRGEEEINSIDREVDRISALVYRINDYLRDARGNPVPLNAAELIEETSLRLCGRNILAADSCDTCMIFMDDGRARSVFENIIRNALESGSPETEIGAAVSRTGGNIRITVMDRGRGIPVPDMKRVFDPFFTSKSTGTGIGLSISERFVSAADGTLTLETREGGGIAAVITLPEFKEAAQKRR